MRPFASIFATLIVVGTVAFEGSARLQTPGLELIATTLSITQELAQFLATLGARVDASPTAT